MVFSKHNIFSKIKDSENFFIVNLLSGNADIVESGMANLWLRGEYPEPEEMRAKGYLVDANEEEQEYNHHYKSFLQEREEEEIQVFFVPSYACNFACQYCYQDEYTSSAGAFGQEITDAFFSHLDTQFSKKNFYITIFGGEPLMTGESYKKNLLYFLDATQKRNIEIAIVTNGYHLSDYLPVLKKYNIREIQVTLDGGEVMHNKRRFLKNGNPTFEKIAEGIDMALLAGFPINLRFVADKENISSLVELADYCIEKGWTSSPLFKTQIGRNYELHHCQESHERLFSRVSLYEALYDLVKKHPQLLEFHKPAFSVSRFLWENGELPSPLFDSCPGCKTEWAYDYSGKIYSCTATVGKQGEELGTFYPETQLKRQIIDVWKQRDIENIEECRDCNVKLACGGGCASVAKNKTGKILSPDCRPAKQLLELGIGLYF